MHWDLIDEDEVSPFSCFVRIIFLRKCFDAFEGETQRGFRVLETSESQHLLFLVNILRAD